MNIGEYTIYNSNLDIDRIQIHEVYKTLVANIWKIQLEFNEQIFFFCLYSVSSIAQLSVLSLIGTNSQYG